MFIAALETKSTRRQGLSDAGLKQLGEQATHVIGEQPERAEGVRDAVHVLPLPRTSTFLETAGLLEHASHPPVVYGLRV